MKRICFVALLALAFLAQSQFGYGAGFLIYEHGAAAMAMGGAFVAVANNPSAVWHNPAGIAFLRGTHFSIGTTLIQSNASLDLPNWPPAYGPSHWEQISQTFYPSNVYLTQSIGEKVTLGFGFCSPFGLGAKWPEENPLKYLGYEDDMKTFFFNPVIAFKLSDQFSAGVGVSYIYSTVKFKLVESKSVGPYGPFDIPAKLEGNGHSWSFNAGLLYRGENVSLGFNYRSRFNIDYSGELELNKSKVPQFLQGYIPDSADGETTFKFPDILGIGVSFNPADKLLISADAHYVLWSRFDKYVVTFSEESGLDDMVVEEKWKDAWTFRGGLQYMLTPSFAVRGGILYDQTPQDKGFSSPPDVVHMDPLLPDANRVAFTAGFGYTFGHLVLDFAYQHERFNERTSANRFIPAYQVGTLNLGEGTYKTTANLFGFSLGFVF